MDQEVEDSSLLQRVRNDFAEHVNARREWIWIAGRIVISNLFLVLILRSGISDAGWLSAVSSVAFIHAYSAASAIQLLRGQSTSAFAIGTVGDTVSLLGAWLALLLGDVALYSNDETYLIMFPIMITLPYRYGIYVGTNIAIMLVGWFTITQFSPLQDDAAALEEFPTRMLFLTSTLALSATFRHFLDQKAKTLIQEAVILRKLNEAKTSFVGTVSHEIRTPLTLMLAFVTRFSNNRENNLTEQQLEFLKVIERNGWHLSMLVDDLVDMSKIENGELAYNERDFSLNELIGETIATMSEIADKDGHRIAISQSEFAIVYGDRGRYRQVLINILSNAFKYSPPATEVSVSNSMTDNGLELRVRNAGGELTDDDAYRIFDLFHRVDNETTNARGGTGIGLYISRVIVNGHGGRIWVESDTDSTTLCLTIPTDRIVSLGEDESLEAAA